MEVHMATLPGVAASVAFEMSKIPLSAAAAAVKGLYKTAKGIDDFFDTLIDSMKRSTSPAIERSGRVFEAAKLGFGFGYLSSATVVAAGQWLMGNQLAAGGVFVTSVTFSNPTVMTCAAMGAVVYGYWALNDEERDELLSGLSRGFSVGKEFIRAIIQFVIDFTKTLLDSDFMRQLKGWIRETAATFGNGLGYVTRRLRDRIADRAMAPRRFFRRLGKKIGISRKESIGRASIMYELEDASLLDQAPPEPPESETKAHVDTEADAAGLLRNFNQDTR
jgi:hypothetical protein